MLSRTRPAARRLSLLSKLQYRYKSESTPSSPAVVSIRKATFYRHHPASTIPRRLNPPLFPKLEFYIPSNTTSSEHWAIIGPSSSGKTTFLQVLRGSHVCIPPRRRTYTYLESDELAAKNPRLRNPSVAIKLVGFDGEQGLGAQAPQSAYLSARYESRREDTDYSVMDYLKGNTQQNLTSEDIDGQTVNLEVLERVIGDLKLGELVDMPVSNLSNGQTRRARIARALLGNPELLLLDEPFMGLDPPTLLGLSPMLHGLAERREPRLVLSLRPQDPIPEWITHLVALKEGCEVLGKGRKEGVLKIMRESSTKGAAAEMGRTLTSEGIMEYEEVQPVSFPSAEVLSQPTESAKLSRDGYGLEIGDGHASNIGEPLIEMEGVRVAYGPKVVLGNWTQKTNSSEEPKDGLTWTVRRGERWGIFGPNGSGKTTLLSLICSDHPQTYSLPIRLFGRSRLPEPGKLGISIFDLQARMGHSSPEIHSHIPRSLSLRQVLENAWADTFRGVPRLNDDANERINVCLDWFQKDLRPDGQFAPDTGKPTWADNLVFGELPFSSQRVALFLRAVIKQPALIILDEAFSGMDEGVRDRCLLFLAHGQNRMLSPTTGEIVSWDGEVKVGGLTDEQALLCISHVKEEIPGSIREWICLPEANSGKEARFGRLEGPIEGNYKRWEEIWGM